MSDDCKHGMPSGLCGTCAGADDFTTRSSGLFGGDTKQAQLDRLCDQLGLEQARVSVGSSLPSHVFREAARQCGVSAGGSMPEIAERIARNAGLRWGPDCDSRHTPSSGGSTVTYEGLKVMNRAIAHSLTARSTS